MHTRAYDAGGRPPGLDLREGFYLDLRDDARRGAAGRVHVEGPQKLFDGAPAYYELDPEQDGRRRSLRITYWFFYGLSQPPGPPAVTRFLVHEGDWERISVLLALAPKPDRYRPVSVRYYTHDGHRDVAWAAVKRVGTGGSVPSTHPVVFSARGSHASFWRAGRYENVYRAGGRRRFAVYDDAIACPDCPQWRTWDSLVDVRAQPWYGFGGSWGAVGSIGGTTGPLGPSPFKKRGLGANPTTTVRQAPAPVERPQP
jgi:hypothetical protein